MILLNVMSDGHHRWNIFTIIEVLLFTFLVSIIYSFFYQVLKFLSQKVFFSFIFKKNCHRNSRLNFLRVRSLKTYPIVQTLKVQMNTLSNLVTAYNILALITHSRHLLNV